MGVWDMVGLMERYKKALERANDATFDDQSRAEYAMKAELLREHMDLYLKRVEERMEEKIN